MQPRRWILRLRCTAKAIDPPQRVVVDFFGVGVCGRVDLARAFIRALVLLEIDAARRVAAAVQDRVFRAGAVMSTRSCTSSSRHHCARTERAIEYGRGHTSRRVYFK